MAGHLGVSKTLDRLLTLFWWPGIGADMERFVKSYDACQRMTPKGRVGKAPMQKMPIITESFRCVGIDLVGPITPSHLLGIGTSCVWWTTLLGILRLSHYQEYQLCR